MLIRITITNTIMCYNFLSISFLIYKNQVLTKVYINE